MHLAPRALCTAAAAALTLAAPASATEVVDNDRGQCPTARHTTIQSGIDAASQGETVLVCAGEYREAVYIETTRKNGLRLRAGKNVTMRPPAGAGGAMVLIGGANNVVVSGFRFAGPFVGPDGTGCPTPSNVASAVAVQGASGVQVTRNVIEDIGDAFGGACNNFVATDIFLTPGRTRATVEDNRILGFQDFGVRVSGGFPSEPSIGVLRRNQITGGPTTGGPQWGILVTRRASATVAGNLIVGTFGSPFGTGDAGGIMLEGGANVFPRPDPRIHVRSNTILRNDRGILLADQDDAAITANRVSGNQSEGIAADSGGDNNLIERNDARGNGELDCVDSSFGPTPQAPYFGTANLWRANRGQEANPSGICRR